MKTKTLTQTKTTRTFEITAREILDALVKTKVLPDGHNIQSIFVRVPSGGDYSGANLDLHENPVIVKAVEEKRKED